MVNQSLLSLLKCPNVVLLRGKANATGLVATRLSQAVNTSVLLDFTTRTIDKNRQSVQAKKVKNIFTQIYACHLLKCNNNKNLEIS